MIDQLLTIFPQELVVVLVAATPVAELRGSIPLGLAVFEMSVAITVLLSLLGNILPVFFIYSVGNAWLDWVRDQKSFLERATDAVLRRSEKRFSKSYVAFGMVALPLFVGVPLPMTGAWTGAIAAFILGIPLKKAAPLIFIGLLISSTIVTVATIGGISVFGT